MLSTIENINNVVNNFIWGVPAMICIIGVGLYLSIRMGFIQIRKFTYAMKVTIGRIFRKREASDGALTPFQAVCTALAATVGTGNIAGVAGAIAIGGPGAVFWMWVSAMLGMCTKFSEVILAVHFREKNDKGELVGGPMYYIKNGLKKHWHWLAYLFSAFGVLTVFGTGNATQVNTITSAIDTALFAVTVPLASTVATASLLLPQLTFLLSVVFSGSTVAVSLYVLPSTIPTVLSLRRTSVTGICFFSTFTVQPALFPFVLVAVITAVPALLAVTVPLTSTIATASLLLLHVMLLFSAFSGVTVAANVSLLPSVNVISDLLRLTLSTSTTGVCVSLSVNALIIKLHDRALPKSSQYPYGLATKL